MSSDFMPKGVIAPNADGTSYIYSFEGWANLTFLRLLMYLFGIMALFPIAAPLCLLIWCFVPQSRFFLWCAFIISAIFIAIAYFNTPVTFFIQMPFNEKWMLISILGINIGIFITSIWMFMFGKRLTEYLKGSFWGHLFTVTLCVFIVANSLKNVLPSPKLGFSVFIENNNNITKEELK